MALRTALGAGRWRVLRQLLTESVTILLAGGVVGVLLALGLTRAISQVIPAIVPRGDELTIDWRVLLFAFGTSVLTGALFGLAPAFQTMKHDLVESLKKGVRSIVRKRSSFVHTWLVSSEIALTVVLLIGCGLMIRSFYALSGADPGYSARNLLTFRIDLPEAEYDFVRQAAFFDQLLERIEGLQGVTGVGATSSLPLGGVTSSGTTWVNETTRFPDDDAYIEADYRFVSHDYFATMGIQVVEGRDFDEFDSSGTRLVAIVDEEFARRFWPDDDTFGKQVSFDPVEGEPQWWEVVGVVPHVRHGDLGTTGREQVYFPYRQFASSTSLGRGMFVVVGTESDPASFVAAVRDIVATLTPEQPIADMVTMDSRVNESLAPNRFSLLLMSTFAGVAMFMALIGVYGLVTYSVTQRNREIGIRMALGARASEVRSMFLRQSFRTVGKGLVLGLAMALAMALAMTRFIGGMLYNIAPTDPTTYAVTISLLAAAVILACYVPAMRATRIDPNVVLREE